MKIAANPAATSSDAGTSASSSRLRALMSAPSLDLAAPRRRYGVLGVVLGAQLVVRERRTAVGRDVVDRHARVVVARVQLDPERQVVGQAAEDRDRAVVLGVGPDEVDGARRQPAADQDQGDDGEGDDEADGDAPAALAARLGAGIGGEWSGAARWTLRRRGSGRGFLRRRLLGRLG